MFALAVRFAAVPRAERAFAGDRAVAQVQHTVGAQGAVPVVGDHDDVLPVGVQCAEHVERRLGIV
ncbi:hypothetical protein [Bifidobacterium pseudolongum]|uniref:hypothetical protein n=1 Tax=Bifidobacterium pseudolongum TaxID=1694 RepID=UPI001A91CA6E|nr:hypothetical protein [Bifidobacterium pseudolongum]